MEIIARLGTLFGLSFVSGINLYATVAVVGMCSKYHLVRGLPAEFQILGHDGVITVALLLYFIEFVVDKIPGLDTLWDSLHTFIRPLGGAMLALLQVGEATPALQVIVFLVGASLATTAHFTKATTRLLINTSPEPFSNILASLFEDLGAISLAYLSLAYPRLSLFATLALLVLIGFFLPLLLRSARMLFAALLFKLKWFLQREGALPPFERLPIAYDEFFERAREPNETVVWTGYGYSTKVPGIPRSARVWVVITSKAVVVLHRRRMRLKMQRLLHSQVLQCKCYPGRLLAKWLLRTREGSWLINFYPAIAGKLPEDLTSLCPAVNQSAGCTGPAGDAIRE
jgi:hypothetical protein